MMGGNGEDFFEPPAGVEPATWWVEATRSIQLSYGGEDATSAVLGLSAEETSVLRVSLQPACSVCHAGPRMVAVAQQVRAPGCGPGGRGFKSPRSPRRRRVPSPGLECVRVHFAGRASSSMAEQRTLNPQVPGSNPGGRTNMRLTPFGGPPYPCMTMADRQKMITPDQLRSTGDPLQVQPCY
jgi:hypothetical protein